jgi:putative ABC transport system permease protein
MNIFKLGFRNIGRNRKRTLINAFTVGAAVMVILLFDVLREGQWNDVIENFIRMGIGHIKIQSMGYDREADRLPITNNLLLRNFSAIKERIEEIPEIKGVYPRLKAGGLISYGGKQSPVVINGLNLREEKEIALLTEKSVKGSFPGNGEYKVLLGKELSSLLGTAVGSIVFLYTRTTYETHNVIDLEVSGIYSIGFSDFEKINIFVPLDILQELVGTDGVSELTIILKDPEKTEMIVDSLRNKLSEFKVEVFPYSHYMEDILSVREMQESATGFIRGILLILALFGILNMMMVSTWERKKEIGTMRAIGYGKLQIVGIFISEGFWIGILGGILGAFIGLIGALLLQNLGIPIPQGALEGFNIPMSSHIYGKIMPVFFIRAFCLGVFTTVIASFPSAARAAFLPIIKALREY